MVHIPNERPGRSGGGREAGREAGGGRKLSSRSYRQEGQMPHSSAPAPAKLVAFSQGELCRVEISPYEQLSRSTACCIVS
jgi:hypothetical protein